MQKICPPLTFSMSEQCTRSGADTKYYDNVVLSEMMDVKQHDLAAPHTDEHHARQKCQVIPRTLYMAPWWHKLSDGHQNI